MRGTGWEFSDSWILEACGLISRTKPTQWGGADVAPPPPPPHLPSTGIFSQWGKRWLASLYRLAVFVEEFADYVWGFLICFRRLSLQPLLFWPREKNFHLQVIVLLSSAPHIWWSSLKWLSIAKQVWPWSTFDEKVVQEISCLWNVFSVTKRKLTARQCLSRSVYREDYLLLATPPPPPLYSLKGIVCRQFVKRNECRGFTFSAVKFFTTLHHPLVAMSQKFRLPMQPLTFHLTTFSEGKTFNSTLWLHMRSRKI